jgi:hypothetical protein
MEGVMTGRLVACWGVALSLFACAGSALADRSPQKPITTVNVTTDAFANNEESLGMDPSGALLAGAWNDWEHNDGCGFSYSTDGGSTWAPESFVRGMTSFTNDPNIPGTGVFPIAGDPSVAYNPRSGLFDVICQTFGIGTHIQLTSTTFDASKADPNADENASYGAAAWSLPVTITTGTSNGAQKGSNGNSPDHEAITVDTGSGAHHHFGRLYVAWAQFNGSSRSPIMLAYSDNDGLSWTGPITVSDKAHQADQDAHPVVGPDGTVYVTWINSASEKKVVPSAADVSKSTDGGNTWSATFIAAPIPAFVTDLPNSQYRDGSDVVSTVDPVSGRLVIVYTDGSTGHENVYAVSNTSAGDLAHWTQPVAVAASSEEQFFPWASAAPNGRVDVVYYDRTCDGPANTRNCVTISSTTDDGASWSSRSVLSTPFDGDLFEACVAFLDPPDCGVHFLGDYIAVASTNAKAQVLYTGNGPRATDVFSARIGF